MSAPTLQNDDWRRGEYDANGHFMPEEQEWASLTDEAIAKAPHETSGVLRMQRHGMRGPKIAEVLSLPVGPQLMQQMERGISQETAAHRDSREIYDAAIKKGTK